MIFFLQILRLNWNICFFKSSVSPSPNTLTCKRKNIQRSEVTVQLTGAVWPLYCCDVQPQGRVSAAMSRLRETEVYTRTEADANISAVTAHQIHSNQWESLYEPNMTHVCLLWHVRRHVFRIKTLILIIPVKRKLKNLCFALLWVNVQKSGVFWYLHHCFVQFWRASPAVRAQTETVPARNYRYTHLEDNTDTQTERERERKHHQKPPHFHK